MAASTVRPGELVIDDSTDNDKLFRFRINGRICGRGLVPDQDNSRIEYSSPPSQLKLIPRSEWSDRIKEKVAQKAQISDILLADNIPSTDQDGDGYCWAYSTGGCTIALRAMQGQPYVKLNPHSVAAVVKNGRDEGGWCGLSLKYLREVGIASEEFWPVHSRDVRNNTAACIANKNLHKVTGEWADLTRSEYDQNLTFDQLATCLLLNVPCATDFNWWSHSVMACDLVEVSSNNFGIRIRNSWTDSYGDKGFAVLQGSKCIPNGAVGLRVTGGTGFHSPVRMAA